ncbi:MAG: flagellar basal body P-ring formation chaperone FlgA [Fidelibacterota bacterium]
MKYGIIAGFLLAAQLPAVSPGSSVTWEGAVVEAVTEDYSRAQSIAAKDIRIQVKSIPEVRPQAPAEADYVIRSENKIGFQTVWLEIYENGIYRRRYPVTIKLSVTIPVVTVARKVSRNKILTLEDLTFKTVDIERNLASYFRSREELVGRQARHVIQPGEILKTNMVSQPYTILRGEQVALKIVVGNLVVETDGIAQSNGQKGDQVRVRSLATGKIVHGLANENKEVLVRMKGNKHENVY